MKPTLGSSWGPGAFLVRVLGGKVPGSPGDRCRPQGYEMMTIGPELQREKGRDEMKCGIESIKAGGVATCPFSREKAGDFR
jgi:hypothetical protein